MEQVLQEVNEIVQEVTDDISGAAADGAVCLAVLKAWLAEDKLGAYANSDMSEWPGMRVNLDVMKYIDPDSDSGSEPELEPLTMSIDDAGRLTVFVAHSNVIEGESCFRRRRTTHPFWGVTIDFVSSCCVCMCTKFKFSRP